MRINITLLVHEWLVQHKAMDLVIDMTCGNGHDTLFLADISKHVVAIDIQPQAIIATQNRCIDKNNITYILEDHSKVDFSTYIPITGAIYNLGYLPSSDKSIITTPTSTLQSFINLYPLVSDFIIITTYRGHAGGLEEHNLLLEYLSSNNISYRTQSADNPISPCTFFIEKQV